MQIGMTAAQRRIARAHDVNPQPGTLLVYQIDEKTGQRHALCSNVRHVNVTVDIETGLQGPHGQNRLGAA